MSIKKEIGNMIQGQYGNSGIEGVVRVMQNNYAMRGVPVKVTGAGNEIKVDFLIPNIIESYETCLRIINNPRMYSSGDVEQARNAVEKMKHDISQGKPQTAQDRQMFASARVTKLTFCIGGTHLVSVPI